MSHSKAKSPEVVQKLPSFFKGLLWFMDFDKVDISRDRESILFQVLEKGRMEHLMYIEWLYGKEVILKFAKRNKARFSRKSIFNFVQILYGKT